MNLPDFSVRRPVFISMVTMIVMILGLSSFSRLQIDMLPSIEMPTLSIRTGYEGADPVVVERLVTRIIEEIVATVPGVEELTSTTSEGSSSVQVRFSWGTDIDTAAVEVQAQLEDEINELPDDVERPRVSKFDVASFPVVILGISSPLDPVELTDIIENQLRLRFATVPGVAQVDTWGQYKREIRIELDTARMDALDVPMNEILSAPRNANLDLPAGSIVEGKYTVTLRAPAEYKSITEIGETVIAKKEGGFITLGQIADITDTYEKRDSIIRVNGDPGLYLAIRKQPHANTVDVAAGVLAEAGRINRDFPQLQIVPVSNQGNFIERSIANVARSVLYGGGLAILVLLLFLRSFSSTCIIATAIPISIVATFAMIYFGGLTINLMTLGGLALGVGMMVDSSVVVLENIYRRRQEHEESSEVAATKGAGEVASAILASTLTTLVIFVPVAFIQGVSGLLFKELGFTVMFALTCSLLVALSLVPMLASKVRRSSERNTGGGRFFAKLIRSSESGFTRLNGAYCAFLRRALHHRWQVIVTAITCLAGSLMLFPFIGSEFLPPSDEGEVRVMGEMEDGTRLELINQQTRVLENLVLPVVPEMESSVTRVRAGGRRGQASGEIRLSLSAVSDRQRSNTEIAADLRRRLAGQVPGMKIMVRAPQGQFILQRLLGEDRGLDVEVRGFDLETLDRLAERAATAIGGIRGITDVNIQRSVGARQQQILLDRQKVADLGLTPRDVATTLETAVAGKKVGEFRTEGREARLFVQLKDAENRALDEILNITLSTPDGDRVAMRNLVRTESGSGPVRIVRKNQQRLITVETNVAGRDLGSVAEDVRLALEGIARPEGYEFRLAGSVEEQKKASRELTLALTLALLLVFTVLACQYESFRDPLIVMASVPFGIIGVMLTLYLTNTTLNLQSYIGCIMLGGIVVNNAILLVDQAVRLKRRGLVIAEAVVEAGRRRLRPILMTTSTTVLALMPLAIGIGEGADAQAPLARAVVGGLAVSMFITLVLIPVVFSLVHSDTTEEVR